MSEASSINLQAFQPFKGGLGKRLPVTTDSASVQIPGLSGGLGDYAKRRVFISNGGATSVFIQLGSSDVLATMDSLELLSGCAYLLTPPEVNPSGVWIAAIVEAGSTAISVCAGEGT